jgi:two-component system KDP operon response regulator KdpE
MPLNTVLVVDDEPKIRDVVRQALDEDVDRVLEAETGQAAIAIAEAERPELVILDLGLPDMDGLEVCRAIRARSSVPIVILSARSEERDKVGILDAGADDYVTKPFSTAELLARIRAQTRRARMPSILGAEAPLVVGDLVIDPVRNTVTRAGESIHLTRTEWALLRALIAQDDRPVTHDRLFTQVWGHAEGDARLYLRVYVAHLRRKLEVDPYRPRLILTEPGVGYRFVIEP